MQLPQPATILIMSISVYAMLKWWFHTSLMDHIVKLLSFDRFFNFSELKITLSSRGVIGNYLVELFECPWCLSFHLSMWLNLVFILLSQDSFTAIEMTISVLATAGGGMFLWQSDSKD